VAENLSLLPFLFRRADERNQRGDEMARLSVIFEEASWPLTEAFGAAALH
jgi:hypothetical protein